MKRKHIQSRWEENHADGKHVETTCQMVWEWIDQYKHCKMLILHHFLCFAFQYRPRYRSSIAARMACPGNVSGKFCYRLGATCKTKQMRHSPLVHTPNSHTEYTRTRTHSSVASFPQWCAVVCRHSIIWNSNIEIPKKFLISIKLFANARTNTLHTHTYTQPHCLPHSATTIDVCVCLCMCERGCGEANLLGRALEKLRERIELVPVLAPMTQRRVANVRAFEGWCKKIVIFNIAALVREREWEERLLHAVAVGVQYTVTVYGRNIPFPAGRLTGIATARKLPFAQSASCWTC